MKDCPAERKDFRPFPGLDAAQVEAFASLGTRRTYTKSESIWREGDRALAVQFVVQGIVLVSRTAPSGDRTVVGLRGSGECLGETPLMEGGTYPADAEALSPEVVLLRLPRSILDSESELRTALNGVLMRALIQHIRVLRGTIDVLSERTVARRLALTFLRIGARFGKPLGADRIHLPVPLSRADLASLVGARVETVIRTLSPWQRNGWLDTRPEGFDIRVAPLEGVMKSP